VVVERTTVVEAERLARAVAGIEPEASEEMASWLMVKAVTLEVELSTIRVLAVTRVVPDWAVMAFWPVTMPDPIAAPRAEMASSTNATTSRAAAASVMSPMVLTMLSIEAAAAIPNSAVYSRVSPDPLAEEVMVPERVMISPRACLAKTSVWLEVAVGSATMAARVLTSWTFWRMESVVSGVVVERVYTLSVPVVRLLGATYRNAAVPTTVLSEVAQLYTRVALAVQASGERAIRR
jgi:hypothetical protein